MTQPGWSMSLPSVTLVCVDCVNPPLAAMALDWSSRGIHFGAVKLLSHKCPDQLPDGCQWVPIPALDLDGYNRFCLRDLWRYVDTEHALTIQTDGYVLRPWLWNNDWLQYDYLGAPWRNEFAWASLSRVGNSGFCLRSRRLLRATAEQFTPAREEAFRSLHGRIIDDVATCQFLYPELAAAGFRFAPSPVAIRFSYEQSVSELLGNLNASFGFHGPDHAPARALRRSLDRFGPVVRLATSYYRPADPWRGHEIRECLRRNLELPELSEVLAFVELPDRDCPHLKCLRDGHDKLRVISHSGMPRFDALFAELDLVSGPDDVCIAANSDILFDGSIAKALDMAADEFWCLSRHEWCLPDDWSLLDAEYSQDTWIWRGRSRVTNINFPLGRCACDNVLAYRAAVAGYRVANPARDVVTRHLHQDVLPGHGAQRDDQRPWLPGPYVYVKPHHLAEPPHTRLICRAPSGLLPFPTDRRPRPEFVIIASRPRAGTYWLWSLLTSMPGVAILEEPFHRRGRSRDAWDTTVDPCLWLRTRRLAGDSDSRFLPSSPVAHWLFGAIVQPDQVHPDRPESATIVDALRRVATHVVILSREDSLAQLASLKIAEATDDWRSAPDDAPRSERVTITQEELDRFREEMAASVAQDRVRWAGLAQLEVTYEQLRDDYDATLKRLGEFLGLDLRYARTGTEKRDRRPLAEVVTTLPQPNRVTVTVDGTVLHVPSRCAEDCRKMAEPILHADEYELLPIHRAGHQVRTVLDVGGNCGAFGAAVRRLWPEARIIAWEPHPDLAACYRLNVPGAEVHEAAAWSSAGPVTLRVHKSYPGGDCVAGAWKRPDEITGECVVPAENVSTRIPADWPEIDVLKLDCEGAESAVLADLAGAGQLARVRWIRGEWHGAENADRCRRILAGTHVSNFAPGDTVGFFIAHRGQPTLLQPCCGG